MFPRFLLISALAYGLAACVPGSGSGGSTGGNGVCRSSGESCGAASECCSGFVCSVGQCIFEGGGPGGNPGSGSTGAATTGGSSTSSTSGGNSTGGTCHDVGGSCVTGGQCCAGLICQAGSCEPCSLQGASCTDTATCCSGLSCQADVCEPGGVGTSSGGSTTGGCGVFGCGSSGGSGNGSSSGGSSTGSCGLFGCGSTGSSSGSSSGSSGGSTGNGCAVTGGLPDLSSCTSAVECACPDSCVADSALGTGTFCEQPCTAGELCTDVITACRNGLCNVNPCGPGVNGVYSGTCNAAATDDGTCYPIYTAADAGVAASAFWACYQGGTATGNCSSTLSGNDPSGLCTPGSMCFFEDAGASGCQKLCDPTASGNTCGTGLGCLALDQADTAAPNWGACFTQTGTCIDTGFSTELSPCGPNAQCGCEPGADFECFTDQTAVEKLYGGPNPFGTYQLCERFCTTTAECPLPYSACVNDWCSFAFCGTPSDGVGISAICNAQATNDGTCEPIENTAGTAVSFGLCLQDGPIAVNGTCDPNATRVTDPTEACVAGSLCFEETEGATTGVCAPICNPDAGTGACTSPDTCDAAVFSPPQPYLGICED